MCLLLMNRQHVKEMADGSEEQNDSFVCFCILSVMFHNYHISSLFV